MCNLRNPDELLTSFLNLLIELLVSDSPPVRNTSRDALGGELSPKLYDRVFKLLYEWVYALFLIRTWYNEVLLWSKGNSRHHFYWGSP